MKKLFVSDLDGTLLKIGNEYSAGVSKENKEMIQKYTSSGNIFAIASARGENYLSVMEQMLGFTPDYIGGNGTAVVCDGQIERSYLDSEFYSQLKQAMRNHRLYASVILHTEQASYLEKRDAYPFGFENPLHTPEMFIHNSSCVPDLTKERPISIAVFVEPENMKQMKIKLRELFKNQVEIVSSDIDLINITPKGCTKGNGILKLMKKYGLDQNQVAVVGDSENDVDMFRITPHSYCMDHSEQAVKERAAHIVSSVAEALTDFMKK